MLSASVIITVYKRTTFLKECVESVVTQQGISRNNVEIIIVSNTDISTDLELDVDKVIYTNDRSVGEKLFLGLKASHSEINFFLEDDDYFLPTKIKTVLPFFSDENVGYVHNNTSEYNVNQNNLNEEPVERIYTAWLDHQSFFMYSKKFWRFASNMSCIAVRKNSLDVEAIRNIQILPDSVIFPMILINGMQGIQINFPLTFIRKHSQNTTSSLFKKELSSLAFKESQFWLNYFKGRSIDVEKQSKALLLKRKLSLDRDCRGPNDFTFDVRDIFLLFQYELGTGFIINDIMLSIKKFLTKF